MYLLRDGTKYSCIFDAPFNVVTVVYAHGNNEGCRVNTARGTECYPVYAGSPFVNLLGQACQTGRCVSRSELRDLRGWAVEF